MTQPVRDRRFKFLGERFTVLIVASILVGIGLYVLAEITAGIWKSVLEGIASAMLALGVVTFASEYILKSAFTEDVLDISDLKHEIFNAGIERVGYENSTNWAGLLASTSRVQIVTLRPARWHANMWHHLLQVASRRPLAVSVVFIDPESASLHQMAARLGLTPESYKNEVKQTALNIEHEWKRAKSKPNWRAPQSSLQIDVVDAVATHSVARVDGRVCLIAEPILGTSGSQETMVFEFRDMAGTSAPLKWLVDGLQDIEERCGTPLFTDVQSGGQP